VDGHGGAIAAVWIATLLVSAILFRNPGPDRARNLAIRAGAVIAVIGMALGYLMTIPQPGQIAAGGEILGAHTVGLADGGPGLRILGWSTVGGDLRIPHFIGMHALQLIPLILIGGELLSHRIRALRSPTVRFRLVGIATAGYAGLLALLTWQALRGQSIVHPDTLTAACLAVIVAGVPRWRRRCATRSQNRRRTRRNATVADDVTGSYSAHRVSEKGVTFSDLQGKDYDSVRTCHRWQLRTESRKEWHLPDLSVTRSDPVVDFAARSASRVAHSMEDFSRGVRMSARRCRWPVLEWVHVDGGVAEQRC
jgi:hypothetical protein